MIAQGKDKYDPIDDKVYCPKEEFPQNIKIIIH
jgi:hypothetical protein